MEGRGIACLKMYSVNTGFLEERLCLYDSYHAPSPGAFQCSSDWCLVHKNSRYKHVPGVYQCRLDTHTHTHHLFTTCSTCMCCCIILPSLASIPPYPFLPLPPPYLRQRVAPDQLAPMGSLASCQHPGNALQTTPPEYLLWLMLYGSRRQQKRWAAIT